MVNAYEKAVKSQWKGRCTVTVRKNKENPVTMLMEPFCETPIQNEPCRLSFQSVTPVGEGVVAEVQQEIKLFIDSKLDVPPGSKITVTQNGVTREYQRSGLSAVYTVHQEITLEVFKGWA